MSACAAVPRKKRKKQVRYKKNTRKKKISKRDEKIINDLAGKFENMFHRTFDKLIKPIQKKYGRTYDTSNEYHELDAKLHEAERGGAVDILIQLASKPYYITIKCLEKIYEKMQSIFRFERDKSQIFSLSPIYILTRPFTFIKPSERYLSFDKTCSITEKQGLDYEKRDVFCAYLYQITTVHKNEKYTPYIYKPDVKKFYKNGINDTRNNKKYKLPEWCNYTQDDSELLSNIMDSECETVDIANTNYVVLNYIYEMENKSNEYLSEFVELEDTNHTSIIENSEELITNYEKQQGDDFHFTNGQKAAIKQCMKDQFSVVLGLPGTGKTEIVKSIIKIYSDYYKQKGKECIISLTAPTGAAIKNLTARCDSVLNESSCKLYGTMHKLCYGVYKLIRDPNCEKYRGLYPDIIVVDETSMADMDIFYRLLVHIKYIKETYRAPKIILLGDDNQLPSVGYGNVLQNIIKSELFSSFKLTEIMRISGAIAKAIIKMNGKRRLTRRDFNNDDFQFLDLNDYKDLGEELFTASRNMIELLERINFNIQRDRIIVAQNSTKDEKLNPWLQNQYLLKNLTEKEKIEKQIYQYAYTNKKGKTIHVNYYDNDRIVRTKNITTQQKIYLTNGDTGNIFKLTKENFEYCLQKSRKLREVVSDLKEIKINEIETVYTVPNKISIESDNVDKDGKEKNIVLDFTRDKSNYIYTGLILYDTYEFELVRDIDIREEIELAYCTTVHKAQGAEFDNVIVWTECWMWWAKDLREKIKLFYTAVSRAKKRCIVIGRQFNIQNFQENRKIHRLSWFLSESWINNTFDIN